MSQKDNAEKSIKNKNNLFTKLRDWIVWTGIVSLFPLIIMLFFLMFSEGITRVPIYIQAQFYVLFWLYR